MKTIYSYEYLSNDHYLANQFSNKISRQTAMMGTCCLPQHTVKLIEMCCQQINMEIGWGSYHLRVVKFLAIHNPFICIVFAKTPGSTDALWSIQHYLTNEPNKVCVIQHIGKRGISCDILVSYIILQIHFMFDKIYPQVSESLYVLAPSTITWPAVLFNSDYNRVRRI